MLSTKRATEGDALSLAPRLRDADARECHDLLQLKPESVLLAGLVGEAYTIYEEETGRAEGMFGASPGGNGYGRVWLLASDAFLHLPYAKQLYRGFPEWVDHFQAQYEAIGNVLYRDNHSTIRLLRHCGFIFLPWDPWGACYEFVRI